MEAAPARAELRRHRPVDRPTEPGQRLEANGRAGEGGGVGRGLRTKERLDLAVFDRHLGAFALELGDALIQLGMRGLLLCLVRLEAMLSLGLLSRAAFRLGCGDVELFSRS